MKKIITLTLFIVLPVLMHAQNFSGRLSSSMYMFERYENQDESTLYTRGYQMAQLNLSEGKFSLRTSLNLENSFDQGTESRLRFYNLYVEGRKLFDVVSFKLGRQPMFVGAIGGIFDGASVKASFDDVSVKAYYGGNVPAYQKLEMTDELGDDFVLGGEVSTSLLPYTHVSIGYIHKNFKPREYIAERLDEAMNPISLLIKENSNQFKFLTGKVTFDYDNIISVFGKYEHDMNYKKTSKIELEADYTQIENLTVSAYFNYREPRIRYNSIFSVFDYGNTQEIEVGATYNFPCINIGARFGNVTYKTESSQRISVSANTDYGSVSYRKTLGYAGELDNLTLYGAHSFMDGMLTPSLGVSFTSYKLSKDEAESNSLMTLLAGVNVRSAKYLSFDLQGQYMNNELYKNDYRVFFKINYWFNTNLNLM